MNPDQPTAQEVEQEVDEYTALVNFSISLRELIEQGFTEVSFVNNKTNEIRRLRNKVSE